MLSKGQIIGFLSCAFLFAGVFLPLANLTDFGRTSYFYHGIGQGICILVMTWISFVLLLRGKFGFLWLTGTAALGLIVFTLMNLTLRVEQLGPHLDSTPLRNLTIQTTQLQWGCVVLVLGAIGLLLTAALEKGDQTPVQVRKRLAAVSGVILLVLIPAYVINHLMISN
jgi:hypothetical protein